MYASRWEELFVQWVLFDAKIERKLLVLIIVKSWIDLFFIVKDEDVLSIDLTKNSISKHRFFSLIMFYWSRKPLRLLFQIWYTYSITWCFDRFDVTLFYIISSKMMFAIVEIVRKIVIKIFARETWNKITNNLSSLFIKRVTQVLHIKFNTKQEKHDVVKNFIFWDSTRIEQTLEKNNNSIIIDHCINEFYNFDDRSKFNDNMFKTLISVIIDDSEISKRDKKSFFRCLRFDIVDEEINEVKFLSKWCSILNRLFSIELQSRCNR